MSARSLSPEEADLMIGRIWYSDQGGQDPVQVHDERVTVPEFDAEKRAADNGGPERVLFVHDLKVDGTLRLGKATGSIYVVLGNIHAGRIELGDAVLAVSGRVTADDYVHAPRTEGNFAVGSDATSDDATIPALPPVTAPIVVWFDPRRRTDLVFNEGHSPTDADGAIEDELCAQALRIARLLTDQPLTATPAAEALRALFCFQASRAPARRADDGSLLLLPEQDRSRWDPALIAEGFRHLDRAGRGEALTRFHLEAGIAACHATAPTHDATDWPRIVFLYDVLRAGSPSPVIEVNRAVAVAMARGALAGLDELDAIPERDLVGRHPYALAAYAELHASLGDLDAARSFLVRALDHQPARAQRRVLERKLAALRRVGPG